MARSSSSSPSSSKAKRGGGDPSPPPPPKKKTAKKALSSSPPTPPQRPPRSPFERFRSFRPIRKITSATKTSLAVIGFVTVVSYAYEANAFARKDDDDDYGKEGTKKTKKKALVLPFDRMTIVERKEDDLWRSKLGRFLTSSSSEGDDEKPIVIGIQELVNLIHEASDDPQIVALYGTFGKGHQFNPGKGHAIVEEVRDAIRVFNESGRNREKPEEEKEGAAEKKASYAFADTFGHPLDPANREYYLASAFSRIHLQHQGELNLFGLAKTDVFLAGTLRKYGIKVHVFKHGKYKNAPNALTETDYTRPHFEQTTSYVTNINDRIFSEIYKSRSNSLVKVVDDRPFDEKTWDAVRNYGTMTCENAIELGLVDAAARVDPLESLLRANRREGSGGETKEEGRTEGPPRENKKREEGHDDDDARNDNKTKEDEELDHETFRAEETTSLSEYASIVDKRKREKKLMWRQHELVSKFAERSTAARIAFEAIAGWSAPNYFIDEEEFRKRKTPPHPSSREKIAIIHVSGTIEHSVARKTISSLRKIEKDPSIKCVVMRVNSPGGTITASEMISEECKRLSKPIVCSMGDVAASGGYYVSAHSDRIFVSPTTLTGSVGVFGVKFDLTDLLHQYGAKSNSVSIGPHSDASNPLRPLSNAAKRNFVRNVDRYYRHFKRVVSDGRKMSLDDVEDVARGRVWTGEQALDVGLADEAGGLRRAVSHAKRTYCRPSDDEDDVDVVVYPQRKTLRERLSMARSSSVADAASDLLRELLIGEGAFGSDVPSWSSSSDAALVAGAALDGDRAFPWTAVGGPPTTSTFAGGGVFATMDETEALRLVLGGGIGDDGAIRGYDAAALAAFPPSFWR